MELPENVRLAVEYLQDALDRNDGATLIFGYLDLNRVLDSYDKEFITDLRNLLVKHAGTFVQTKEVESGG